MGLDLGEKDNPMPAVAESGSDETLSPLYTYGFLESRRACSPNFVFATACFQKTRVLQRPRPKSRMTLKLHLTAETRRTTGYEKCILHSYSDRLSTGDIYKAMSDEHRGDM